MMFGRPQAPQKEWANMYFYEKVHHLVDHTADFVISKASWWIPSVAVSMAVSMFFLGGPDALPQAASVVLPAVNPLITTPSFSSPEGERGGAGPADEEEF